MVVGHFSFVPVLVHIARLAKIMQISYVVSLMRIIKVIALLDHCISLLFTKLYHR